MEDKQKKEWDKYYSENASVAVEYDNWLDQYLHLLEISRGVPIIDLGCGTGNDTKYLVEKGFSVISTDYSDDALNVVRKMNLGNQCQLVDLREKLPYEPGSAFVVIANLSLHYFNTATTMRIISDIKAILKDEGYIFMRVNSSNDINHGAGVGEMIEDGYYHREGVYKHFFNSDKIDSFFSSGYMILTKAEKSIVRCKKEKILWEVVAKRL